MTRDGFSISDSGYVYRRTKSKRGLGTRVDAAPRLGHISDLLRERTPRGELVRNWWTVYVAELEKQFPSAIADGRSPDKRQRGEKQCTMNSQLALRSASRASFAVFTVFARLLT